jgi:hypothetical protein
MKAESRPEPRQEWRIAEQHFSGTPDEVSAQIDRLILTLIALRQRLVEGECTDGRLAPRLARPWARVRRALRAW